MDRALATSSRWFLHCFAVSVLAGSASAAEPELQAVGETSLGYLNSVQSPPEGGPGRVRTQGVTWVIAPGLVLTLTSEQSQHRFGYRYQHDFLFAESVSNSSTNTLDYLGFFDLSRRVGLALDGAVVQSNQNSSLTFSPPGTEFLGTVPLGSSAYILGRAGETFLFDVAEDWRAWQGGTIVAETPILGSDGPRTVSPGARLGIERLFIDDAVGVEARASYTVIEDGVRADGSPAPTQRQLLTAGVGTWRHDWGRDFASRAEAGVARFDQLATGTSFWSPIATAAFAYLTEYGDAEIAYSHAITTNPVLGQTFLSDEVRLRGGLPLTKDRRFVLAMTGGYRHGNLIDEIARREAEVDTWMADAALGWYVTQPLLLSVRYQHVDQWSDVTLPGLPERFVQNAVLLGATLKWPPDTDMPRAYRAPRRVDATDEIRDTKEPPREDISPPGAR